MKIPVEINDGYKTFSDTFEFNYLELIKHFGCAGMGHSTGIRQFVKGVSALGFYWDYFQFNGIKLLSFVEPNNKIYDPTEKSHFSNLTGKAIADFLSKKVNKAKVSISYEAAMKMSGHQIKGGRPDLYCTDSQREQFAIECKGYSRTSVSGAEMMKYKKQSKQGPLPKNFSIASVTYDIFGNIRVVSR